MFLAFYQKHPGIVFVNGDQRIFGTFWLLIPFWFESLGEREVVVAVGSHITSRMTTSSYRSYSRIKSIAGNTGSSISSSGSRVSSTRITNINFSQILLQVFIDYLQNYSCFNLNKDFP